MLKLNYRGENEVKTEVLLCPSLVSNGFSNLDEYKTIQASSG